MFNSSTKGTAEYLNRIIVVKARSHWRFVHNSNGNSNILIHICKFAFAVAIATAKWVPNPFHDDVVAVAVAVAIDALPMWTPMVCIKAIHDGKNISLPLPLPSLNANEP